MPSAKIVAQNPAGSFRPLSSFGHASLAAPTAALARFSADSKELPRYKAANAATASTSFLYKSKICIGPSRRSRTKNTNTESRQNIPQLVQWPVGRALEIPALSKALEGHMQAFE